MPLTGAQAIIQALEQANTEVIFGYPGAAICPFYDALVDSQIRHILTRTEQGAAHAASGYARASGRTGVCVATSGPGSTNLITGIATAYMDSVPLVALTGQVISSLIGHDSFQEADMTGATSPFTKHNYLVKSAGDLPRVIKEAFYIASTGRPGPVLIDIPQDVQAAIADFSVPAGIDLPGYHPHNEMSQAQARDVMDLLKQSKAPLICAGGGIIASKASAALRSFSERHQIPVVTTLMGIGSLPAQHPHHLGMLGSHGVKAANEALHHADLVIIIGARIGNRAMGASAEIAKLAKTIHIDIDPAEIGKNIRPDLAVVADARAALTLLGEQGDPVSFPAWLEKATERKQRHIRAAIPAPEAAVVPPTLMRQLAETAGPLAIITTEVGQNQIWAANHYPVQLPGTFLSSGGMGTMGYGLPAAIGAKIACPDKTVIAVSGDGSFQMSMQELGTIKQQQLGIKMILLNNQRLGMVHEMQKQKFSCRYSQVFLNHNPDFSLLAIAYGIGYARVVTNGQIAPALQQVFADDRSYLLECQVSPDEPTLYT
jgi:acetolactate synthase-1/2/3 large subunit